jgi:hypothetical protein
MECLEMMQTKLEKLLAAGREWRKDYRSEFFYHPKKYPVPHYSVDEAYSKEFGKDDDDRD